MISKWQTNNKWQQKSKRNLRINCTHTYSPNYTYIFLDFKNMRKKWPCHVTESFSIYFSRVFSCKRSRGVKKDWTDATHRLKFGGKHKWPPWTIGCFSSSDKNCSLTSFPISQTRCQCHKKNKNRRSESEGGRPHVWIWGVVHVGTGGSVLEVCVLQWWQTHITIVKPHRFGSSFHIFSVSSFLSKERPKVKRLIFVSAGTKPSLPLPCSRRSFSFSVWRLPVRSSASWTLKMWVSAARTCCGNGVVSMSLPSSLVSPLLSVVSWS